MLAVGDDELGVGDDEDASCCRGARVGGTTVITWMGVVVLPTRATRRAGSVCHLSGQGWGFLGDARAKRFRNTYFYYHIRVLLVKTNRMTYICCIKYGGITCVLAVGDDELDIAHTHTKLRQSEVAEDEIGNVKCQQNPHIRLFGPVSQIHLTVFPKKLRIFYF